MQNGYLGPKKASVEHSGAVQKTMQVKNPSTAFVLADEGPFTEKDWNETGLNDTRLYVIYGNKTTETYVKQHGHKDNITNGSQGSLG
jgi:hypothetical protein